MYMRVSSDTPVTTDSVDTQRVACQRILEQLGLPLVDVYVEPERAATEKSV
jgi:hypothetical protein